jgi:hypothetical protein
MAHLTKASSRHCLVVPLRPQKLRNGGIRKQVDLLSSYAGHRRKLLPKRTHSKDIYDRPVDDVFVDGRYVEELLKAEDTQELGPANGIWLMANGQPGDSAR